MNVRLYVWYGVTALTMATMSTASAMSVKPVVIDLFATGNNRTGQITVSNDGAKPLPVEIHISKLELSENGDIISTAETGDEFLVFPPQAMVPPGATQVVRVQWVGGADIKQSQSYLFSINQVPVKMPESTSGIQVVFNFTTIVNIAPLTGQSSLSLIGSGVTKDNKGVSHPQIIVKNTGNIHAKLTEATVKLSSNGWTETLSPERLKQVLGVGLVQPGKTRKFILPIDLPVDAATVAAQVDYKPDK